MRLADVAELNPRKDVGFKPEQHLAFVPMSAVSAESALTERIETRPYSTVSKGFTPMRSGDLLVAKITPCFENGKIAYASLPTSAGFGSTEFHVIRANAELADARYLLHYLRQPRIRMEGERRMTGSGGQRRVPAAYLAELRVPLLPLSEQRHIADILDRAETLRSQRRQALAKLDALAEAIFLDLLTSQASTDWPQVTIGDIASKIRTGPFGSQLLHSEFVEDGVPVLGIDNVVQNQFVWARPRFITATKFRQLARYRVSAGDVLITIMGTCGRCAVVPDDIPVAINTKHLCCITLDQDKCLPDYLKSTLLLSPDVLHQLGVRARGAVMPGLNMQVIRDLRVTLPPLAFQRRFVMQMAAITMQVRTAGDSLAQLTTLFTTLQHRAFQGEL